MPDGTQRAGGSGLARTRGVVVVHEELAVRRVLKRAPIGDRHLVATETKRANQAMLEPTRLAAHEHGPQALLVVIDVGVALHPAGRKRPAGHGIGAIDDEVVEGRWDPIGGPGAFRYVIATENAVRGILRHGVEGTAIESLEACVADEPRAFLLRHRRPAVMAEFFEAELVGERGTDRIEALVTVAARPRALDIVAAGKRVGGRAGGAGGYKLVRIAPKR